MFFDFFFSNSMLLPSKKLANYLRIPKKLIFLNNICLNSILQNFNYHLKGAYAESLGISPALT